MQALLPGIAIDESDVWVEQHSQPLQAHGQSRQGLCSTLCVQPAGGMDEAGRASRPKTKQEELWGRQAGRQAGGQG